VVPLLCVLLLAELPFLPRQSTLVSDVQAQQMGRVLDVYTNKEPHSGKGQDQESDAFEPQEEVILYGLVTYNLDPVAGKIVAFNIIGPSNSFENITLSLSNVTGEDGIASVRFLMPWPDPKPKESIFGTWIVVATVDIASVVTYDVVAFKAGWIIELLYIKTTDANNALKTTFLKGEQMGFRVGVKNIAMTDKTATLAVSATDELNAPVGTIKLENEVVPPGETEYFLKEIVIPLTAFIGQGTAVANALKTVESGIPVTWCPSVETTFEISLIHDVAVTNVVPSATEVSVGEQVYISVVVKNKGRASESFKVSTYFDGTVISTIWVQNLAPGATQTLVSTWSTYGLQPGNYTLKAIADAVPGETNLEDNVFIDGTVRLKEPIKPPDFEINGVLWLLLILFIFVILTAAFFIFVLVLGSFRRRRRRRIEEVKPALQPLKTRKTCRACGREFLGVYTFCPHCLSYDGKDFA
jgi:hypothetical protein